MIQSWMWFGHQFSFFFSFFFFFFFFFFFLVSVYLTTVSNAIRIQSVSLLSHALRSGRSGDRIPVAAWFSEPVKWPGRGVALTTPTPSSAKVKERVGLYLCSPCRPSCSVLGWKLPSPLNLPELKTTSGGYSLSLSKCEVLYYHGTSFHGLYNKIEDKWVVGERERVSVHSYALEFKSVYIGNAVAKQPAGCEVCCVACCGSRALKGRHSFQRVSCGVLRELWRNWLSRVSRGLRTCCEGKYEWREGHCWNGPNLCTHYVTGNCLFASMFRTQETGGHTAAKAPTQSKISALNTEMWASNFSTIVCCSQTPQQRWYTIFTYEAQFILQGVNNTRNIYSRM